jgi:hypothetical protein
MSKVIYLNVGNQFIIINNITFLEAKDSANTIIHFTGGNNLPININKPNLIELIERELKKPTVISAPKGLMALSASYSLYSGQ